MACQHSPDDQILWLQAGTGEDDFLHLLSSPDCVACQRQEEEDRVHMYALRKIVLDKSQTDVTVCVH